MCENAKKLKPCTIQIAHNKYAIIDPEKYDTLKKFAWRAVQAKHNFYAKATIYKNGLQIDISMHRFIARTPFGLICHHKNGNSLDNRRSNLENMDKLSHTLLHRNNRLRKKFAEVNNGNG